MSDSNNAIAVPVTTESRLAVPTKDPQGTENNRLAYIGFRGAKSEKRVDELEAAGVEENTFYLQDGETIPLDPCAIHLLESVKVMVIVDKDTGDIKDATFQDNDTLWKDGYRPKILAVVLARLSNGKSTSWVPATLMLSSGQCKALAAARSLLTGAASRPEEWASRSPRHAASAAITSAGGRFYVQIRNEVEKSESGRNMNVGYGVIIPTPAEEVEALNAFLERERDPRSRLSAVFAIHDKRVEELRQIEAGETTGN